MKAIKGKSWKDNMKMPPAGDVTYPSLYVSEDEVSEIESWEVGKEYELKIRVKMTTKDEYANGDATNARLEVVAYEDVTPKTDEDPSTPKMMSSDGYIPKKN